MSALSTLDWPSVRKQYDVRQKVSRELRRLHAQRKMPHFIELLLGISDPTGNYSAAEHGLGPKILAENLNAEDRLHAISTDFLRVKSAHEVLL